MAAPIPFPMIIGIILVFGVGVILAVPFPMIVGFILVVGVGVIPAFPLPMIVGIILVVGVGAGLTAPSAEVKKQLLQVVRVILALGAGLTASSADVKKHIFCKGAKEYFVRRRQIWATNLEVTRGATSARDIPGRTTTGALPASAFAGHVRCCDWCPYRTIPREI